MITAALMKAFIVLKAGDESWAGLAFLLAGILVGVGFLIVEFAYFYEMTLILLTIICLILNVAGGLLVMKGE